MPRVFVLEGGSSPTRAMFLTSMRPGVALPALGTLSANFASIWDTPANTIPVAPGWGAWNADNVEFLLIERISLQSIYMSVTLTNNSPGNTVSYSIVPVAGAPAAPQNIAPAAQANLTLRPKERLNLYRSSSGANLNYTYMVSSGHKVIDYNDTRFWSPQ
jgi:hypothetical protein